MGFRIYSAQNSLCVCFWGKSSGFLPNSQRGVHDLPKNVMSYVERENSNFCRVFEETKGADIYMAWFLRTAKDPVTYVAWCNALNAHGPLKFICWYCGAAGAGRWPGPGFRFPLKWWDSLPPSGCLEPAN